MQKEIIKENVLEILLEKIRQNPEIPAISSSIDLLSNLRFSEEMSFSELTNEILKDYSLTTKVLKLVNSAYYARDDEVTTISRAAILLGFENVKNLAVSIAFFAKLQSQSVSPEFKDLTLNSLYSAILSQELAKQIGLVNREEAFLCSLFHSFGKVMLAYFMPDHFKKIIEFSQSNDITIDSAATSVINTTFENIGMSVAKEWNFPKKITQTMQPQRNNSGSYRANEIDKLSSIATFTNDISNVISDNSKKEKKEEQINGLIKQFKTNFPSINKELKPIINNSISELPKFTGTYNLNFPSTKFAKGAVEMNSDLVPRPTTRKEIPIEKIRKMDSFITIDEMLETTMEDKESPETIFAKGIQDINNAILNNYKLNDIVMMSLEIIYRGMKLTGVTKILFFVKDLNQPILSIRFGFGENIDKTKSWFRIPLGNQNDIFNLSISKKNDLVIQDINSEKITNMLPVWYKAKVSPLVFVIILPIIIDKVPLGLFYLEGTKESFKYIGGEHLKYLKILRDQVVLSIKQREEKNPHILMNKP